jgi:hypothetical protein
MQHARPNRLRRAVAYAAFAAVLGVVALTLSQCTMVGDSLNGVQLERGRPTTCIKQCNDLFALLFKLEQKRHDAANNICQSLDGDAQQACQQAESAQHQANKDALTQGKTDCQNNCHRQGAGTAG